MRTPARTLIPSLVALTLTACGGGGDTPDQKIAAKIQAPSRTSEMTSATDTFGKLVVSEGDTEVHLARHPWSSWWLPVSENYLFEPLNGQPAPLQKYDAYVQATRGTASHAAQYEQDSIFNADASSWSGRCDAWAEAAVLEDEPTHGATLDGVSFGVGDLKALLVETYDDLTGLQVYGQRNDGQLGVDYNDIYPDQFHKLLQVELFQKGEAFNIDKDPGVAVWMAPIFEATISMTHDATNANVMHVQTSVAMADPWVESVNFVGTKKIVKEYTYDLFGYPQGDGTFQVVYGMWTGDSLEDHPDFAVVLPQSRDRKSYNTQLDTSIVDEIEKAARTGS